ncbi:hypothetical protein DFH08DRAFT_819989 [Mycena albidolilacea]|uniref:Uncharacterized protein n=1 Tax=Mycena albidolilacea TaxID=1033008 RepID=A0AAD6ZE18_9AGAR|nr:hypothetical protein DFH08DRAFT_819989 [Mycena albidolilacea]
MPKGFAKLQEYPSRPKIKLAGDTAPLPPSASTSTSTSFNNINPNITSSPSAAAPETAPAGGKQRRISLALPSSPRAVPAWHFRDDTSVPYADPDPADSASVAGRKGKVRRIELEPDEDADAGELEGGELDASPSAGAGGLGGGQRRERGEAGGGDGDANREETAPQVDGGRDTDARRWHGVGSWKAILSDPTLEFQGRYPVDLKGRVRMKLPVYGWG